MEPVPSDYAHIDAAASHLAHILCEAGIRHVFLGGYAAWLLGSKRVTKVTFPSLRSYILTRVAISQRL